MRANALATVAVLLLAVRLAPNSGAYAADASSALPAASLTVHADQIVHPLSPYLAGACIEDVNHEIYGGLYSQMIFGESFQEPPIPHPVEGFTSLGGLWTVRDGEIDETGDAGAQLVSDHPGFADGEVGIEVFIPNRDVGVAAMIVRTAKPSIGIDTFDGYEVAINARSNTVMLARHRGRRREFHLLKEVPFDVRVGAWTPLTARLKGSTIEVLIDGQSLFQFDDGSDALGAGTVSLRPWKVQHVRYRNLKIVQGGTEIAVPFRAAQGGDFEISRMWRRIASGSAEGKAAIETEKPFAGSQSQRLTFTRGEGAIGIENQGLNRQGIGVVQDKAYEGYLWARADVATPIVVSLQSRETGKAYAETTLRVTSAEWERLDFTLTPDTQDASARFVIELRQPGSVVLGHAFLQPGEWGRFRGLPVRRDVVQGLIDQGIKVLRYGGSMVNAEKYRWKQMIGPRDRRPPYPGQWYPYSTNGWGIIDFLNLCEAAHIRGIPDFNINETPGDMADFVEYANGPADSNWGRKRVADGHAAPYGITHIELGNEERIDDTYVEKFSPLAAAIWAMDPNVILVVGDFAYNNPITDPMSVSKAASKITSLAGHQKILELARQHHREVWFDVHLNTEGPAVSSSVNALPTYIDAIDKLADGAAHKVVVFELNAGNPAHRRALANAHAILSMERDGRLPLCTSANGLQVDHQNDNGWNQGLLFFNSSKVWLQPPGYVSQMISKSYQPTLVKSEVEGACDGFEVNAKKSEDGKQLALEVLNNADTEQTIAIRLSGFMPTRTSATVQTLAGPLDAQNTADAPDQIKPVKTDWQHPLQHGVATYRFPPRSFSIIFLE